MPTTSFLLPVRRMLVLSGLEVCVLFGFFEPVKPNLLFIVG